MPQSIVWKITQMTRRASDGFVDHAHYRVDATDGDLWQATTGEVDFSGELAIPYEDLTEETVLGWVKDRLGAEAVQAKEASLTAAIDLKRQKLNGLPWDTPAAQAEEQQA